MKTSDTHRYILLGLAALVLSAAVLHTSDILATEFNQNAEPTVSQPQPTSTNSSATNTPPLASTASSSDTQATNTEPKTAASTTDANTQGPELSGPTYSTTKPQSAQYIEVVNGCDENYQDGCLNVRSNPSTSSPVVTQLRNSIVLKVASTTQAEGRMWYKTEFAEWLQYPNRVSGEWWVAGEYVRPLKAEKFDSQNPGEKETDKRIVINLSEQQLRAYDGEEVFMQQAVSTGLPLYPTPRGTFPVYKMTPSRYMQGPIPGISDDYYDLPGVPWNLYFTYQGAVIHGAYWHNQFGRMWSHGCVNLPPNKAEELYRWATLGTQVIVRD